MICLQAEDVLINGDTLGNIIKQKQPFAHSPDKVVSCHRKSDHSYDLVNITLERIILLPLKDFTGMHQVQDDFYKTIKFLKK